MNRTPRSARRRASRQLAAKVPGWTRYWVAEEKLKQTKSNSDFFDSMNQ